jgi:DNA-binding winged helix-turn-helix (wHTH) protein
MIFRFEEFELDPDRLELRHAGCPIKADALVLRLLAALVRRAGQLVTKQELIAGVWDDRSVSDNVITVTMTRLRKTLGHRTGAREFVTNVHGRGYRFVRAVSESDTQLPPVVAVDASSRDGAPFVGREPVLDRLREAWLDARGGHGSVCVLTGEPGIGKTRAVEQLAREAAGAGFSVAWGYCHPSGGTPPLWPLVQLVREVMGWQPREAEGGSLSPDPELSRLLPELGDQARPAPPKGDDANLSVRPAKHQIFDAIARVLVLASERKPCVLVLDDLHGADAASLELLNYWVDEIARARILVVATLRKIESSQTAPNKHLLRVLGHRNCTRLPLARLRESDVAAYVAALVDDPREGLAHEVFVKSEGIPFFMVELVRRFRDANPFDPDALKLPDAALELVRQRVLALDDAARGVLSCAAVIGRDFELNVLRAVTERETSALMAVLDDAIANDVIVAKPESRTEFAFGHELLRGVLYDALAPAERRACHLRVAKALEQRHNEGDAVPAALLAHHFWAALPESDLQKTVDYCSQAADAAARVYAYADGMRHLRRAREALDLTESANPPVRMILMLTQALYARACSSSDFEPLTREIIALAREQRAGMPLARAALMLDLHPGFPALPGSREALEDALAMLPPDDDATRGAVLARLATNPPLAYDAERSRQQASVALALGRKVNSLLATYAALTAQAYLTGGPGHEESAAETLREIELLSEQNAVMLTRAPILIGLHRAITALQRGNVPATTLALEWSEARCRKVDSRELLWHVERFQALSRVNEGSLTEGAGALRTLHRRASQEAILGSEVLSAYDRAVVLGEAASLPKSALRAALALDAGDPPSIWSLKVRALAAAWFHEDARDAIRTVTPNRLSLLPRDRDYLGTLGALARAVLTLRARDYAEAIYPLLSPYSEYFAAHVGFFCEGSVSELLGRLAGLMGRRDAAIDHLRLAVALSDRAGLAGCAAQARLELASSGETP